MKTSFYFPFLFILLLACQPNPNKNDKDPAILPVQNSSVKKKEQNKLESVYRTNSGKGFELITSKDSLGMTEIVIVAKGFEFTNDSMFVREADPINQAFITDLNSDGFEEFYLTTVSEGSGSYAKIYGISSNSDKSATPIYVPEPSEKEFEPGSMFEGYMGHDSIYLDGQKLFRQFPIYKEGDPNCCPTGGKKTLRYSLEQGEASWILKLN